MLFQVGYGSLVWFLVMRVFGEMNRSVEPRGSAGASQVVVLDDLDEVCPGEVYVLTVPTEQGPALEMRRDGRGPVVHVYTRLSTLVLNCGEGQPWELVSTAWLREVGPAEGFTQVAVDAPCPGGEMIPGAEEQDKPPLQSLGEVDVREHVYVPSRPAGDRDERVELELQPYQGEQLMLVFSSPEAVEEGCGPYQSFVEIRADAVEEVAARAGARYVVMDEALPREAWRTGPVQQWHRRDIV